MATGGEPKLVPLLRGGGIHRRHRRLNARKKGVIDELEIGSEPAHVNILLARVAPPVGQVRGARAERAVGAPRER
jgi:hypothetical protein